MFSKEKKKTILFEEFPNNFMYVPIAFETARGHDIERENYKEFVQNIDLNNVYTPNLSKDLANSKGVQCSNGFWITSEQIAKSKKKVGPSIGIVRVSEKNLIEDGQGGYFLHVTRNNIEQTAGNGPERNYGPNNFSNNYHKTYDNRNYNHRNYNNNQRQNDGEQVSSNNWRNNGNNFSNGSLNWRNANGQNSHNYQHPYSANNTNYPNKRKFNQ